MEMIDVLKKLEELASKSPEVAKATEQVENCLLYTSPSPRDQRGSRIPGCA